MTKKAAPGKTTAGTVSKTQRRKKMTRREKRFIYYGLLFSAPWIIGFLCFQLYPLCCAVYYSFTDYNIFGSPQWIGLGNFKTILQDSYIGTSIKNTSFMAFIGMPIGLVAALLIAMLLSQKVKGLPFFRTIYYLPTVVPVVASAMLFMWLLNSQYGLVNNALSSIGIQNIAWLSDPRYTKWSLIIMDTWRCGQSVIVFLAALKGVPSEFYEAASIDGANGWKKFTKITLPSIAPTIQFLFIMGLISSFQYFTQAYVFASVSSQSQSITGGPGNSLMFYSLYLYKNAFNYMKMGYASALALVLFFLVMICSFLVLYVSEKRISYDYE